MNSLKSDYLIAITYKQFGGMMFNGVDKFYSGSSFACFHHFLKAKAGIVT
jgi:hypothetical protein